MASARPAAITEKRRAEVRNMGFIVLFGLVKGTEGRIGRV